MSSYQEIFIENLKFYRSKRNISQSKLAELCGCATPTIGCIESARQFPSFELLFKMADALEINPADLFLRNASETVLQMKKVLKTELIPQITTFVDSRF